MSYATDRQALATDQQTFQALASQLTAAMRSGTVYTDPNQVAQDNAAGSVPLIQVSQQLVTDLIGALDGLDARLRALGA